MHGEDNIKVISSLIFVAEVWRVFVDVWVELLSIIYVTLLLTESNINLVLVQHLLWKHTSRTP
jgi:hypothetical protein